MDNYLSCDVHEDCCVGDDEDPKDASISIVPIPPGVEQIAVGSYHTCALIPSNDEDPLYCWGSTSSGQLGDGVEDEPIGDDEAPISVDVGGKPVQISAGAMYTCALLEGGTIKCWGSGAYGQLGSGDVENIGDDEPVAMVGPIELAPGVAQITGGNIHTCAVLTDGALKCWGHGGSGKLGYGNTLTLGDEPTDTPDLIPPVEVF